jgi:hypothetical protein
MKRTALAALLSLGLLGAACANSAPGTGVAGDGSGPSRPTGADQLVVRISSGGGFIAPTFTVTQVPQFSLMGNGIAITPGAVPEIYPGPAIAPLFSQQLTPDAVDAILALARTDGLLNGSHDYANMGSVGIADASTTTITVVADGGTHTFNFYALGDPGQNKPEHMGQQESDARTKAQDFSNKVGDLTWLPSGSAAQPAPYLPTGVRVFVGDYHADPSLTEPSTEWPLDTSLADFGDAMKGAVSNGSLNTAAVQPSRCGTVTGQDLTSVLPLIDKANQLTPWKSGGRTFGLSFRPLLPDESGC